MGAENVCWVGYSVASAGTTWAVLCLRGTRTEALTGRPHSGHSDTGANRKLEVEMTRSHLSGLAYPWMVDFGDLLNKGMKVTLATMHRARSLKQRIKNSHL